MKLGKNIYNLYKNVSIDKRRSAAYSGAFDFDRYLQKTVDNSDGTCYI